MLDGYILHSDNCHRSLEMDDDTVSNKSQTTTLAQLMAIRLSRRDALKGMTAAGAYGLFGCAAPATQSSKSSLTFTESGRFMDETHHVAARFAGLTQAATSTMRQLP